MIGFGRTLRNLGSRASAPAMGKAQAIATGTNTPRRLVRHTGGGSSAGLNAQKTARLEMNSTGYANPNIHRGNGQKKAYPSMNRYNNDSPIHFRKSKSNSTFDTRKPKMSIDK
jgi:hypothetical protein